MSTATEIRQGKNPYSGNNGLSTTQVNVNGSWQLQSAMYAMTDWCARLTYWVLAKLSNKPAEQAGLPKVLCPNLHQSCNSKHA